MEPFTIQTSQFIIHNCGLSALGEYAMHLNKLKIVLVMALITLITMMTVANTQAASTDWTAVYWANKTLSGEPDLVQQEANLDHDWGGGSPGDLDVDVFSARFTKTLNVPPGTYRFTATMDDGLRFWVDNVLVIDSWTDSQVHSLSADVTLSSGDHNLKVEYYNAGGVAVAKLSWVAVASGTPGTISNWRGEYFNNRFLTGTPSLVRDDQAINFDWGVGSPASGIGADNFSVRWTRNVNLGTGRYRFTAVADDGVRLWVNGQLLIDQWHDQAATHLNAEIDLAGGSIPVQMEYYENVGGASASLAWLQISGPPPTAAWKGEYFNNKTLSGSPALIRDDANITFNWGTGSPAANIIDSDNFSVRWTRTFVNSTAGRYRFTAFVDDGVRVWANGQLVINAWSDHTPQQFMGEIDFAGGNMNVIVEYYDNTGGAQINITRTQLTTTSPVPPVPAGATATVASLLLNVRQGPSVTTPIIVVLTQGQTVSLLARNAQTTWVQVITSNGVQGWVYAPLLQTTYTLSNLPIGQGLPTTPPPTTTGPTATVSNAVYALNVRSGPGMTFDVITAIPHSTQVTLIGRNSFSTWLKVRLANGTEGWSSATYLNTSYNISSLPVANS
jgi:uncharacterized protein YgiM (DUF1202 family)